MTKTNTVKALAAFALFAVLAPATPAQEKRPGGALGDLTAVDTAKGALSVRTAAGATVAVATTPETEYLRVEPGKVTLEGAERIGASDLRVGDRVWARGTATDASGVLVARQVVLMSAEAIAERQKREAAEWRTRGVMGDVKAVNASKGEITLASYRGNTVVVAVSPSTALRRLAAGTRDFAAVGTISLADVAVGSQVAARGEWSEDKARLSADAVVLGSFPRPVRGTVASIAGDGIAVTTRDGATVRLALAEGVLVRKLPAGAGRREAGARQQGFVFQQGERDELEKRTKAMKLADLAAGDYVFAVAEPDAGALRAVVLVKIEAPPARRAQQSGFNDALQSGDEDPF